MSHGCHKRNCPNGCRCDELSILKTCPTCVRLLKSCTCTDEDHRQYLRDHLGEEGFEAYLAYQQAVQEADEAYFKYLKAREKPSAIRRPLLDIKGIELWMMRKLGILR